MLRGVLNLVSSLSDLIHVFPGDLPNKMKKKEIPNRGIHQCLFDEETLAKELTIPVNHLHKRCTCVNYCGVIDRRIEQNSGGIQSRNALLAVKMTMTIMCFGEYTLSGRKGLH